MTIIRSDGLFYCPRCTCQFCTAQRRVVERYQQRTYEYEARMDQLNLERMEEAERVAELNRRHQSVIWMVVMAHSYRNQIAAVATLARHMEIPATVARHKVVGYQRLLGARLTALLKDPDPAMQRLRAARAMPPPPIFQDIVDYSWAVPSKEPLPTECSICGGTYPEGRHCKRNSCRRKRGR